jgi:hypothetical protein
MVGKSLEKEVALAGQEAAARLSAVIRATDISLTHSVYRIGPG